MNTPNVRPDSPWWRGAVGYEVYIRSFADASGDGIGDLDGITSHLEYLEWLGIDAVWITPFYPSPGFDHGYDVSNYTDIDPIHGSLGDFDRLVDRAHSLGLRVVVDIVPNHSSSHHPWFLEAVKTPVNAYRGLLCLAGSRPRRRAAEQLGESLRGTGMDLRREIGPVLLPPVSSRAAPTSTGTTSASEATSTRYCASGWIAAPTGSASMSPRVS